MTLPTVDDVAAARARLERALAACEADLAAARVALAAGDLPAHPLLSLAAWDVEPAEGALSRVVWARRAARLDS